MVETPFVLFELMVYALTVACAWHAYKQGTHRVIELITSGIYGVVLELATMAQLQGYHYGRFLIMIGDAPLAVGMGWAVIIYSSMEFSERIEIPEVVKPFADALLALNIDLAMDAIAIRLGFWTWHIVSLEDGWPKAWFGVPWGNFWGWFVVVSSFSLLLRTMRAWRGRKIIGWAYPILAMAGSVLILMALDALYTYQLVTIGLGTAAPIALMLIGLAITLAQNPKLTSKPVDPVVAAVPLSFHTYFILAAAFTGIFARLPALIAISAAMALLGAVLHLWPLWAPPSKT